MSTPEEEEKQQITLTTRGKIALITLNVEKKLNALTQALYYRLACLMRDVAARDDIYITVLTGKGRYFSAGADVTASRPSLSTLNLPTDDPHALRSQYLRTFVTSNLEITHAFYTHPKILITALNGPCIGLSAALIAWSDFIYATPSTFLLTPFTSLGLVAEGGASVAFVQRLGIAKANEALIMSKRIPAKELLSVGFLNGVFDAGEGEGAQERFLEMVLREVEERFGDNVNGDSLLGVKRLIRGPERAGMGAQVVEEVLGGLERFVKGVPQEEFRRIASGEKKHKL